MSQEQTLRQRIRAGEVLVALRGSVNTSKSQLADIWATDRYDYIWIDGQHTAFSEAQFVTYCAAAEELGIDVQLRIPHTRQAYLVGRYLDLGCSAVLVPEVMEVETVDDAIGYAYYPQIGRRSWGGAARRGLRGVAKGMDRLAYAAWWNDYVILSIQVESVEAVTNIRKLAKPGVSVVTFGPNDLSFNLEGHVGYPLTSVDDCMRNVAAQLEGTGIRLAMGTGTKPEEREKYLEMGITLFQEDAPA
ncbi:MAG: aldolase/citrate lyase family protein [Candidatus Tectomicrobia bacterium]|nr:aldolase/citrate lyase family protein [Candidatus Tectomicrobia bacterium]